MLGVAMGNERESQRLAARDEFRKWQIQYLDGGYEFFDWEDPRIYAHPGNYSSSKRWEFCLDMKDGHWAMATIEPDAPLIKIAREIPIEAIPDYAPKPQLPPRGPPSVADQPPPSTTHSEATPVREAEPPPTDVWDEAIDYVTLDQAAALVHTSKRTLERYKTDGILPDPVREGGGGKYALYDYKVLRPWLMEKFKLTLPERFPGNVR
jgi:hypothetical protein